MCFTGSKRTFFSISLVYSTSIDKKQHRMGQWALNECTNLRANSRGGIGQKVKTAVKNNKKQKIKTRSRKIVIFNFFKHFYKPYNLAFIYRIR